MKKKIGVLLIHGMGSVPDDYAHDAIQELRERVSGRGLNRDDIAWQSVYWAPILSDRESRLWVDLSAENDLNWAKLRKFFTNAFGSVSAYQSSLDRCDNIYDRIHSTVSESLKELRVKLGNEDKPLIVIAHSMGSAIMSNYIWDRQKGKEAERFGGSAFERMETLAGMVTLGSNIPLFTLACEPVVSIEFPPATLSDKFRKGAKWLNLYDSDDALGWPLKPLSPSYAEAVTADLEVNVGNILTSWNPANHAAYWADESVMKPTAYLLSNVLEACDK
jgi:pimeloyl-ACP methyl ester carboxylesterase